MSRELFDPYTATPSNPKIQYDGQVLRRKKVNLTPGCFKKSDVETAVLIMKSFGYWPYLYRPLIYPHYSTWSRSFEVSISNATAVEYTLNDLTNQVVSFVNTSNFHLPVDDEDHYNISVHIHFTRFFFNYFLQSADTSQNSLVQGVITGLLVPPNTADITRTIVNNHIPSAQTPHVITLAPSAGLNFISFRYTSPDYFTIQHYQPPVEKSIPHTSFYTWDADPFQSLELAECLNHRTPYPDDDPQNWSLFQFSLTNTNSNIGTVYSSIQFIFEVIVESFEGDTVYQFPQ